MVGLISSDRFRSLANPSVARFHLQRKCACGGAAGITGACDACKSKKLLGKPIQTKLQVNEPGDVYEQEADRVAERVMRMSDAEVSNRFRDAGRPLVQRRTTDGGTAVAEAPPIVHDVLNSPGRPLDAATRAFFEPRFGHDFSLVRVHTDSEAGRSAQDINAHAYTVGHDIVFGAGRFSPETREGRRLLAHELTHVAQRRSGHPPVGQRAASPSIVMRRKGDEGGKEHSRRKKRTENQSGPSCEGLADIYSKLSPKEEAIWQRDLPENFPRLRGKCFRVLREGGDNCCGYCLHRAGGGEALEYGTNVDIAETIEEFDRMFGSFYEPIASAAIDTSNVPEEALLALFAIDGKPKHTACRSGIVDAGQYMWESKISHALPLILHHLGDLEGGPSGDVVKLYRRRGSGGM